MSFWTLPFIQIALGSGLLAGTALAWIGVFMATRRVAFSGLAASQMAALGTVIGAAAGWHYGAEGLALLLVLIGSSLQAWLGRSRRTAADSWVAALYVLGAGAAVLLLSKSPRAESETLGLFFGNILALSRAEVLEAGGLFVAAAVILGVWLRRWVWLSFDAVGAEVAGMRVGVSAFIFQTLFAAGMTLAIHIFGALLAFAYLILPATTALLLAKRLRSLFAVTTAVAVLGTVGGFALSLHWDFPTGPFVAVLLGVVAIGARLIVSLAGEE